jgi:hypothetical protein
MAKGISINFLADVRDFLKGTKNVEDELDDVADALDDVARDGEQATEKLEDGFKELAKASKKAGDDIGDNFKKGTKDAEEGLDTLNENAKSNAKEVTASFDGSVESIVDGFQGLAAEAFEGFGPAGLIAGAALAAGIGLATAEFQRTEEEAQKARERIADLGLAMIEAGASGERPLESVIESLQGIVTNSDDAVKKFDDIRRASKFVGTSAEDLAIAYAGQADALEGQLDVLDDLIAKEQEVVDAQAESGSRFGVVGQAKLDTLQKQQEELQKVQEETERAAAIEQAWLAAGGAESLAKADAIAQIDAAYDEAVFSVDNFLNAETGIYDLEAYAASIEERGRLLQEYQTSLAESGLTTEQKAALNEMGVEQASAILKGLQDPNTSQKTKDTIKRGLGEASKEGSGVAEAEIKKAFEKPINAKVDVKADTAVAQRDLDNLIKARTAIIKVDFQDRYGKRVY